MALESATYISDLNASNPAASDGASQGDDHIRLLKAAIKATFPNITGPITPSHTDINGLAARLAALELAAFKPGDLKHTLRGGTVQSGWLLAQGQAVSRTTYAALFAEYGTLYGSGDGVTTFNLPDLRGRTLVGLDNMGGSSANRVSGVLGAAGTTLGAVGGDQYFQAHNHGVTETPHSHTFTINPGGAHTHTGSTGAAGSHDHALPMSYPVAYGLAGGPTSLLVSSGLNGGFRTETTGSHAHSVLIDAAADHTHTGTISSTSTGLTVNSAGTGASQNLQPLMMVNIVIFAGA